MDERIIKEIDRLKEEIYRQKEKAADIKELVKEEIHRDFPVNFWELSERELDNEMGMRLSFLNDNIDTRPEARSITSHRRIIGKPIVLIKRLVLKITGFYTNTILEKQRSLNEQLVAFHLASFIRFRHNERKIKEILEKIKALEENQELILDRLAQLKNGKQE
jgi:hypothetical protein